jgi:hypothetical protein
MVTHDGSLITMPFPRTLTSVFAVPRSIAMSSENRPKSQLIGLNAKAGSSMKVSKHGIARVLYLTIRNPVAGIRVKIITENHFNIEPDKEMPCQKSPLLPTAPPIYPTTF